MYIFPAVACQTPTDLAAHLAHSPYHRTRENGSPGATSSAAYSSRNSQTRPGGAVRINRSRLIVNNRQIIRNSRASSIASLQYNRHQERRPTTAGLTAHRPAQPQVGTATCSAPETSSLYWGGPHKWAAPLQPPTPCKHNTTPKQRPRRRQEHLLLHTPVKNSTAPQMITPRNLLRCLLTWQIRRAQRTNTFSGPLSTTLEFSGIKSLTAPTEWSLFFRAANLRTRAAPIFLRPRPR